MGNKSRLTQDQIDDICASYEAGLSQRAIGEQQGISTMTVCRVLARNSIEARYQQGGRPLAEFCKRGHELKDPNLYYIYRKSSGTKYRVCRTCVVANNADYYQRVTKHKPKVS